MSRTTIDYGIDLGTTNSSIAVVSGPGTEIIRNNVDSEITPSAVYINAAGNLWIGQSARSKVTDERAEEDVVLEFKRRMGTGYEYAFRAAGQRKRPEELSAEVLKALRADVAQKKGEDLTAAVITVPAAFELHQCEATKKAAVMAGFKFSALLQEPVAAALAYGYQRLDARAYWLIFDFGGGTFDAALIRSGDGNMVVANHGGDNFLGGSDIDWAIVRQLLAPRIAKQFGVAGFERGNEKFKHDLQRLKAAAENAKIELSRKDSAYLETTLIRVAGQPVTFETEISRADVARVAEPIVMKAVDIARKVLSEKKLAPAAIERLVFVGGPTLAPYFRELVRARLEIPFDLGVDPLTVVARGAAIFAGTQRLERTAAEKAVPAGQFSAELIYKPVGSDPEPLVGGKVAASAGALPAGCTIEVVNQQSKWRSGKVALSGNGAFQLTARAEKGVQNIFLLELRDATGTLCKLTPDQFAYTVGVVVEEQTIINNLAVATADNKLGLHFTKGQGLPAKITKNYRTSQLLRPGQTGSVLRIPIVEGNHELADRNVLVGMLEISSDKIKRELPAGSEVEVTLGMDASRLLTVLAFVPILDEEFPAKIELGGKVRQPDAAVLRSEFGREKQRLAELRQGVEASGDSTAIENLRLLEVSALTKNLEFSLHHEGTDFDALLKADRELIEFKVKLDGITTRIEWPSVVKEAETWLTDLDRLVNQHGTAEEKNRAKGLREQIRAVIAEKNGERLRKKIDETVDAYSVILYRQPSFWENHFNALAQRHDQMGDPVRADRLLQQGGACKASGNLEELIGVVYQLQDLLPKKLVADVRRGYGSGLVT